MPYESYIMVLQFRMWQACEYLLISDETVLPCDSSINWLIFHAASCSLAVIYIKSIYSIVQEGSASRVFRLSKFMKIFFLSGNDA